MIRSSGYVSPTEVLNYFKYNSLGFLHCIQPQEHLYGVGNIINPVLICRETEVWRDHNLSTRSRVTQR